MTDSSSAPGGAGNPAVLGHQLFGNTLLLGGNGTNITTTPTATVTATRPPLPYDVAGLKLANKIILIALVSIIMLSMGCVVEWRDMWKKIKRPVGIGIGLLCQFLINPLLAFALAQALSLSTPHAIGVLVIATSPGGTTSNIFTYWSDGDVSLSICMTTASTVAAFGMMPLNLFLYSRAWTDRDSVIPYQNIAIALLTTAVPVIVGMLIRWRSAKVANYITKAGSASGLLAIIVTWILQGLIAPHIFLVSWRIYFAAMALPWLGFSAGYLIAMLFRMSPVQRRTVSLETGCQNVGLCLGLIAISYSVEGDYILFPLLYGITIIFNSFVFVAIYKLYANSPWGQSAHISDTPTGGGGGDGKVDGVSDGVKQPPAPPANGNLKHAINSSYKESPAELKSVKPVPV